MQPIKTPLSFIEVCLSSREAASAWNAISWKKQLFQHTDGKWMREVGVGKWKTEKERHAQMWPYQSDLSLVLIAQDRFEWTKRSDVITAEVKDSSLSPLQTLPLPFLWSAWRGWRLAYDMTDYIKSHRCSTLWH